MVPSRNACVRSYGPHAKVSRTLGISSPRPLSARWRCNAKVSRRLPHTQARPAAGTGRPGQNDLAFRHHASRNGWCMSLSVLRLGAVCLLGIALQTTACLAQAYPERVVRIVNPFPPGGSVDVMARLLAQKLSENVNQQVIVENRAGAGGNTGADSVAKSDPDGYTLLFTAPGPLVVNQTLYSKGLPFDPEKDFAPIAIFARTPIVLMVHPSVPAKDVKELIAFAKANPGKVYFGSAGMGSTPHLSGELFKSMTGTELTHVPYRGTGPAMNDLVGGHIQMFFD